MKSSSVLRKLEAYCRQGYRNVTRFTARGFGWLVRLARHEPRAVPTSLEPCAAELRHLVLEAQVRAEETVLRTAEKLRTRFGAASQGLVTGKHQTHPEVIAWRHRRPSGSKHD